MGNKGCEQQGYRSEKQSKQGSSEQPCSVWIKQKKSILAQTLLQ